MGIAVIAIVYLVALVPLAGVLVACLMSLRKMDGSAEIFEGIAASCLVSVCAALLLTKGIGVQPGILVWLVYCAICGALIWLPERSRAGNAFACAIAPSFSLLGTLLAIYFIPLWLNNTAGAVASTTGGAPVTPDRALSITLLGAVLAIPGIAAAILARTKILAAIKGAWNLDAKKVGGIEKALNTLVRIGTSVAAIFVVVR